MWMYCPGRAGVKESDRADRLVGKTTCGLNIRRSEMLRSLKHNLQAQSQEHHWSPGGDRRWKRKPSMIFLESIREGHCQSNKTWNYLKSTLKETWEMGQSTYRFSQHIDTILNWSALNTPLNRGQGCSSVGWTSVTVHCWCRFNSQMQRGTLLPD